MKGLFFLACLLLLLQPAMALAVDVNGMGIAPVAGSAGSADYNTSVSVGQTAAGRASSANYTTYIGFYYASSDTTPPEITILGPAGPVTSGSAVTFSFIGTDDASAIAKYWVRMDGGGWIDNGTATTYSFSPGPGEVLPAEHTFYVKATNDAVPDLNSGVASRAMRFESATGGAAGAGTGATPGGTPVQPVVAVQLFSASNAFTPLSEPSIPVLDQTATGVGLEKKRFAAADELLIIRSINAFALMGGEGVSAYWNKVFIEVRNIGGAPLSGVEIIEGIGKGIVGGASLIHSDDSFEVIEPDPILRFFLGDVQPGEKKTVSYDFNRSLAAGSVTQEMFNGMAAPTALVLLQQGDACMGVYCNDSNPCTRDYCKKGECVFAPMNGGAKCAEGNVCQQGKCAAAPAPEITLQVVQFTPLELGAVVALAGAAVLGVAWQFTAGRWRKKKSKLGWR